MSSYTASKKRFVTKLAVMQKKLVFVEKIPGLVRRN
jgi:hypothetical protein